MSRELGFIEKILNGQKTIESRWYQHKYAPWNKIAKGDMIYFKDTGKQVTAKAEVEKVIQFSNLDPQKIQEILEQYGGKIGITFTEDLEDKKYGILIFLQKPEKVPPFNINKKGFGNMASWLTIKDIGQIKHES